jgi:cytosine deaminase
VTKLSATPPEDLDALTVGLSEAGVAVTALPATDLYLNGREYRHLIPRGVAPIHRLAAAGVVATIGTNKVLKDIVIFDASSGADGVATIAPAIAGWKNGRRTFFRPPPQLFFRTDSSVDSSLVPASSFWPRRGEGA